MIFFFAERDKTQNKEKAVQQMFKLISSIAVLP